MGGICPPSYNVKKGSVIGHSRVAQSITILHEVFSLLNDDVMLCSYAAPIWPTANLHYRVTSCETQEYYCIKAPAPISGYSKFRHFQV